MLRSRLSRRSVLSLWCSLSCGLISHLSIWSYRLLLLVSCHRWGLLCTLLNLERLVEIKSVVDIILKQPIFICRFDWSTLAHSHRNRLDWTLHAHVMAVLLHLVWFSGHLALTSLLEQSNHFFFLLSQDWHFILVFHECLFLFSNFLFTLLMDALLKLHFPLSFLNSSCLFIPFYLSSNLQFPEPFLSFFFLKFSHSLSLLFFACSCLFQ